MPFPIFKSKLAMVLVPAAVCLALDLSAKAQVMANIDQTTVKPVTFFFNLILALNSGVAFSLFSGEGPNQGLKMIGLSLLAMIPLIWFYRLAGPKDKGALISLGLVLGGTFGNIHDRLRYRAVVDFLDFHWGDRHWPAFNLADVAICLGLILLVVFTAADLKSKPGSAPAKTHGRTQAGRKRS